MPKGFKPEFIEVRLSGAKPVIRRFSWDQGKLLKASQQSCQRFQKLKQMQIKCEIEIVCQAINVQNV